MRLAFVLACAVATPGCERAAAQRGTPPAATLAASPSPAPSGPIASNGDAVRFALDVRSLGVDPDGNLRYLAVARFSNANGEVTRMLANDRLAWRASSGVVQWQTRMRFGQPSAIVSIAQNQPLTIALTARTPSLGTQTVSEDPAREPGPRVVARALGPNLVQIGWFPQTTGDVRIDRIDAREGRRTIALIAGPASTFRDATVRASRTYRYVVLRPGEPPVTAGTVVTPPDVPRATVADASGKGMWLFFTTDPRDAIYFGRLDPRAIVAQAVAARLRYVELRTAYGAFWEVTPEAKPTIDAIVDGLADNGIATIAWTVPRDAGFDDLAQSVRSASYRTARGTPLRGVAVDLERGDDFMNTDANDPSPLWQYAARLRAALGPSALIASTVEDPYFEHLTQAEYPYEQLARVSSVLQPMSYWRMMRRKPTSAGDTAVLLTASIARLRALAGAAVPVNVGGQTSGEGRNGPTSPEEIDASLRASRKAGAIGECFFDWNGTSPAQWSAIGAYDWRGGPG